MGDQVGENIFKKFVCAKPLNPSVCPILSIMAVMMFGFENSVRGNQKLQTLTLFRGC